jgi:hypothetical protein
LLIEIADHVLYHGIIQSKVFASNTVPGIRKMLYFALRQRVAESLRFAGINRGIDWPGNWSMRHDDSP